MVEFSDLREAVTFWVEGPLGRGVVLGAVDAAEETATGMQRRLHELGEQLALGAQEGIYPYAIAVAHLLALGELSPEVADMEPRDALLHYVATRRAGEHGGRNR